MSVFHPEENGCVRWIIALSTLLCVETACQNDSPAVGSVPASAQSLILVTVDTWRADHFLERRANSQLTPRLAEFAARSLRFNDASSVSNQTSPGVAGILTGLLPRRSGVVHNEHVLPSALPTLASVLSERGFLTGAFVANPVLSGKFGFARGFSDFEVISSGRRHIDGRADELSRLAIDWLGKVEPGQRYFLWLHYMDPHGPYEPPAKFLAYFDKEKFQAPTDLELLPAGKNSGLHGIPHYQHSVTTEPSADARDYLARYAAEVRSMDHELGGLLESATATGLLESAIVVITADHGEALNGDHGYYFAHSQGLTQDQVHVPLLLYYPGCEAGREIDRPVSGVDVVPTVMALLQLEPLPDFDGQSLLNEDDGLTVSQVGREVTLRRGVLKLRWRQRSGFQLFDVEADPAETKNLATERGRPFAAMKARMREVLDRPPLAEPVSRKDLSKEEQKQLEALGYL